MVGKNHLHPFFSHFRSIFSKIMQFSNRVILGSANIQGSVSASKWSISTTLPPKCSPFPQKFSNSEILTHESGSSMSPNVDFFPIFSQSPCSRSIFLSLSSLSSLSLPLSPSLALRVLSSLLVYILAVFVPDLANLHPKSLKFWRYACYWTTVLRAVWCSGCFSYSVFPFWTCPRVLCIQTCLFSTSVELQVDIVRPFNF